METFSAWWQARSDGERTAAAIACLAFIFLAGIDIGRALFEATH